MPVADAILQPYVDAPTLPEAENELDRLAGLYDELAEAAAEDDQYGRAAQLEAKAIAAGCRDRFVAREMRGWYLLKAGATEEGEAVFRELCTERPDDPEVRITLAHARSDAGFQDAALDAFNDALADDRLAPAPRPPRTGPIAWAVAWFPPDQRQAALERWPELSEDLADPERYAQHIERRLRDLHGALGHRPAVAPLDVEELLAWAADEGYDPSSGAARSMYAAELHRTDRSIAWPPGRNEPCWCRSGRKYKRCCSRA